MASPLRSVVQNWQLKLLALALAVLLWVINSAEQVTSQWIAVPVQVFEEDPNYQLLSGSVPREVRVRFTGSGRDLIDVAIRKPPLRLVITRVDASSQAFRLEPDMVRLPSRLAVNAQDVDPGRLELQFRRVSVRSVPVEVALASAVGAGWTLADSLTIRPERIEVRGPAEEVERIAALRTIPVALSPSEAPFSRRIPIDTSGLGRLDLSSGQVEVAGRLERITTRRLRDVPVSVGPGLAVAPPSVAVTLAGPRRAVEGLGAEQFRVVVAIDSIPGQLPPDGLIAPLRVEGLPARVRATPLPAAIRLLPTRPAAEPLPDDMGPPSADGAGSEPLR